MPECPTCSGERELFCFVNRGHDIAHHSQEWIQCRTCDGTGLVSSEKADRITQGRKGRAARLASGMSLMQAARMIGITPVELSAIERGE